MKNPPIPCHFPYLGVCSKKMTFFVKKNLILPEASWRCQMTSFQLSSFLLFSTKKRFLFYFLPCFMQLIYRIFPAKYFFFHSVILSPAFGFFSSTFAFFFSRDQFTEAALVTTKMTFYRSLQNFALILFNQFKVMVYE